MTDPYNSSDSPHAALAAAVSRRARSAESTDRPAAAPPIPRAAVRRVAAPGGSRSRPSPGPTLLQRNRLSVTALCVVVAYIVLAKTTGVVLLGIFPALLGIRALRRREQLAPLALIAAAISVFLAVSVLSHH